MAKIKVPGEKSISESWSIVADAFRNFLAHHGFIRASALTYTTLLAVIPSVILLSSLAGSTGAFEYAMQTIPKLDAMLEIGLPLDNILPILEHAGKQSFGSMGLVGTLGLLITFIAAMGNLEANLNVVWGIRKNRKPGYRVLIYLPFLTLALAFIGGLALYVHILRMLTDQLLEGFLDTRLMGLANKGLWIAGFDIFVTAFLFLVFWLIPNLKVQARPAFAASLVVLLLFHALGWLSMKTQGLLFARFSLLYGSLAFIPVLMLSVYSVWIVILLGNSLSWRLQLYYQGIKPKLEPEET